MPSPLQLQRISATDHAGNFSKPPYTLPETSIIRRANPVFQNNNIQIPEKVASHHSYRVNPNQCCSAVVQTIKAPADIVWSVVRRFDKPQAYKHFLKSCKVVNGDGKVPGTVREVHVVSGLPAESSMERLEILDDENHVLSFKVVGGDHRLANYQSVTTLHCAFHDDENVTVVVESYVVDVPAGNTREETCVFVDTIVKCNLQSLTQIAENKAAKKDDRELL